MTTLAIIWFAPAAVLLPIVVSDFRRRRISVLWLAALFAVTAFTAAYTESPRAAMTHFLYGCALVALLMLCLAGYLKLRYRRIRLGSAFGAGDRYCIVALSPMFPPADLLKLLVASALAALAWDRIANRGRRRTIPFAGMIGITLICVTIIRFCMLCL